MAVVSNDARICLCCKESSDNLDAAVLGCQHQRCCPLRVGMVDICLRCNESPNNLDVALLGSQNQRCDLVARP